MIKYKLINNVAGWLVFAVAAVVYLMTIEPTASFWDCGEFITQAYKLEVGHPPGAPVFMLVGNLFSQFAGDASQVAKMVNAMSALMSAFTILFLFWTITHLTRKLLLGKDATELSLGQTIAVIGSGLVGALAYTFSDTFWFSAVEGEVYAFSSALTALVFWLILKWEDNAHKPHSDKWIVLIAYIMGLSIGVHLLNLLCIPAIVLVYYFKKTETPTWKGTFVSLLISFGLIVILLYGIIPGFTKVGGWFELFFVNTLGMPFNSGLFVYLVALVGAIAWSLFETISPKGKESRARFAFFLSSALAGILFIGNSAWLWVVLVAAGLYFAFRYKGTNIKFINLAMTSLMVILIGFSAYAIIPIRSAANPPLDLNSPEDVFSLGRMLNREQYGQTPLFYGSTYASQVKFNADGSVDLAGERKVWNRALKTSPEQKDRYESSIVPDYKYTHSMFFTRMHSNTMNPNFRNHILGYERWGGVTDQNTPPSFLQNLQFFFSYQVNFMYWRYFMWNFSGRQNDIQSDGGITNGNWITGIPFFDQHVLGLGPQDHIAPDIVNNKGRNKYFMLPFLLGIAGIIYQLSRRRREKVLDSETGQWGEKFEPLIQSRGFQNFLIVLMLFFMTGLAIVLYLNQTPFEPRERDYAYAGSFYAFAIWIGMGVAGISLFLRKYLKNTTTTAAIASTAALLVPLQMASQNWDDHDRSGRTLARDTGMNYLSCVGENGILFTNGDNDTYPLWYVQETEGFRTDVRVTNLSFLQTEWYVDQLMRQAYESEPLPVTWSQQRYYGDMYTHIITKSRIENTLRNSNIPPVSFGMYYDVNAYRDTVSLNTALENLRENRPAPAHPFSQQISQVIPGDVLSLDVDTANVDWKGLHARPASKMYISLGDKSSIHRQELMILEMLNNINKNNWERPIHFATTIGPGLYMNLQDTHFSLNGLSYQVVPGTPLSNGVNTETAFENMMNFRWGGLEKNPDIYLDETSRRMISTFRLYFSHLIEALIGEGRNDMALAALDKATAMMPSSAVAYGSDGLIYARAYYTIGEAQKGAAMMDEIVVRMGKNLDWFERLKPEQIAGSMSDIIYNNINPLIVATSVYRDFDETAYKQLRDQLMERAGYYYSIGIPYLGDLILKELTDRSIRNYYRLQGQNDAPDTAAADSLPLSIDEETMDKALRLMQQYSPRLLEQYTTTAQ